MLIVEGPDLVGKTTLCKELARVLNHEHGLPHDYAHLSKRSVAWQTFAETPVPLYLARAARHTVQDRFHMSDPIYACIRKDNGHIVPDDYALLDGMLRGKYGMMTVLMFDATDNCDVIRSRWRDGEMYNLQFVTLVNLEYRQLAKSQAQLWVGSDGIYRMPFDFVIPVRQDMTIESMQMQALDIAKQYVARQWRLERAIRSTPLAQGL